MTPLIIRGVLFQICEVFDLRKVTVPIDMSSEQKTILGILSKRQLIYLIICGAVLYAYIPIVFNLFSSFNIIFGLIMAFISAIPIVILVLLLGFIKKQKLNMYYDQYLLIKFKYKTQIGIWRKGNDMKDWMVKK